MIELKIYSKKDECECIISMIDLEFEELFLKRPHKMIKGQYVNVKRKFDEVDTDFNDMGLVMNGLFHYDKGYKQGVGEYKGKLTEKEADKLLSHLRSDLRDQLKNVWEYEGYIKGKEVE